MLDEEVRRTGDDQRVIWRRTTVLQQLGDQPRQLLRPRPTVKHLAVGVDNIDIRCAEGATSDEHRRTGGQPQRDDGQGDSDQDPLIAGAMG